MSAARPGVASCQSTSVSAHRRAAGRRACGRISPRKGVGDGHHPWRRQAQLTATYRILEGSPTISGIGCEASDGDGDGSGESADVDAAAHAVEVGPLGGVGDDVFRPGRAEAARGGRLEHHRVAHGVGCSAGERSDEGEGPHKVSAHSRRGGHRWAYVLLTHPALPTAFAFPPAASQRVPA